jgi:hypothetical protein
MVLGSTELLERDGSSHKICEVSGQSVSKWCRLSFDRAVFYLASLGINALNESFFLIRGSGTGRVTFTGDKSISIDLFNNVLNRGRCEEHKEVGNEFETRTSFATL